MLFANTWGGGGKFLPGRVFYNERSKILLILFSWQIFRICGDARKEHISLLVLLATPTVWVLAGLHIAVIYLRPRPGPVYILWTSSPQLHFPIFQFPIYLPSHRALPCNSLLPTCTFLLLFKCRSTDICKWPVNLLK